MGPRAALILAMLALAAGCSSANYGGGGGSGGSDAGSGGSGGGGSDLGLGACTSVVVDVERSSDSPPATLTAHALASGTRPVWSLSRAGDPNSYEPHPVDDAGYIVSFPAELAGTWTFRVAFPQSQVCAGQWSTTLVNPNGNHRALRLRALPPSGMFAVTDLKETLVGGTPRADLDITLSKGTTFSGHALSAAGMPVPGELRMLAQDGSDTVGQIDASGAFAVSLQQSGYYRALFIPDSALLAPTLDAALKSPSDLNLVKNFVVGAGEPIAGRVRDRDGVPIGAARVALRAGDLPSGLGVSDGDSGAFSLRAQPGGGYMITVGGDDWPEATVGRPVTVPVGGLALDVTYGVTRAAVSGIVTGSDDVPLADARVTIRSRPPGLGTVAVFTVGAETLPGAGRVGRVVTTLAGGALPPLLLPPGSYDVIVDPPPGSHDGLTAFVFDVFDAPGSWAMKLAPPIVLSGHVTRLSDGHAVKGARVTAHAQLGLGAMPTVVTDDKGIFVFNGANRLGAGTPSTLLVAPPPNEQLAGVPVDVPAGATSADVVLAPGMTVSGIVSGGGNLQSGVRVESLCTTTSCPSPVEASTVTDREGRYTLYLTDPGEMVVDGGTKD